MRLLTQFIKRFFLVLIVCILVLTGWWWYAYSIESKHSPLLGELRKTAPPLSSIGENRSRKIISTTPSRTAVPLKPRSGSGVSFLLPQPNTPLRHSFLELKEAALQGDHRAACRLAAEINTCRIEYLDFEKDLKTAIDAGQVPASAIKKPKISDEELYKKNPDARAGIEQLRQQRKTACAGLSPDFFDQNPAWEFQILAAINGNTFSMSNIAQGFLHAFPGDYVKHPHILGWVNQHAPNFLVDSTRYGETFPLIIMTRTHSNHPHRYISEHMRFIKLIETNDFESLKYHFMLMAIIKGRQETPENYSDEAGTLSKAALADLSKETTLLIDSLSLKVGPENSRLAKENALQLLTEAKARKLHENHSLKNVPENVGEGIAPKMCYQ